jgi:ABC-type dipeptide/oligopeptide/nickel transport system permease component
MKFYILKRLLYLIPIMIGITFLSFLLLYLAPGDPAQRKLTAQTAVTSDVLEQTREEMGLNRPFLVQYKDWFLNMLQGDLGVSYKDGSPVIVKLTKGMKYTGILAFSSFLLSVVISIPLGIYAAVKKDKLPDSIIKVFCFAGNSLANFLVAVALIYFFCIQTNLFPIIAKGNAQGLFLPTLSLSIPFMSRLITQTRAAVLEQLEQPYVAAARARGMKEIYILFKNVLHNSMISITTVLGLALGTLLGGSVVTERIFMWPGIGKLVMDSIQARDYPVIQGFVMIMTGIYIIVNLLVDISYHFLDPRVKE